MNKEFRRNCTSQFAEITAGKEAGKRLLRSEIAKGVGHKTAANEAKRSAKQLSNKEVKWQ